MFQLFCKYLNLMPFDANDKWSLGDCEEGLKDTLYRITEILYCAVNV